MNNCEICQNPEDCNSGKTPCDLSGEFHAPVPADVANLMLKRIHDMGMPKKFVNNDAAIAIAEEAFRAGFDAGRENRWDRTKPNVEVAWSEFEPSETCKDLTR